MSKELEFILNSEQTKLLKELYQTNTYKLISLISQDIQSLIQWGLVFLFANNRSTKKCVKLTSRGYEYYVRNLLHLEEIIDV